MRAGDAARIMPAMPTSTPKLTTERLLVWMAWRRYLTSVRAGAPGEYEIVEERAWEGLLEDLASVGAPLERESRSPAERPPLAA